MAAREPTAVEALRETAQYIDPALQPTLNELPALFAALVEGARSSAIGETVEKLKGDSASLAEIRQEVAHVIAPPDPDAGATVVQGVPPEAHQAVLDELAQMKESIRELREAQSPAPASTGVPLTPAGQLTPEQMELQTLREKLQSLRSQAATAQHPTASSEPVPDDVDTTPPPVPPAPDEAGS